MKANRGFTLVELITVIVVLSIVAAIGSGFVVTAIDSYRDTEQRAKLVQKGRLAIEQMTRQLRIALPHSLRVSASGDCIEFMPVVGGATYVKSIPDQNNGIDPDGSSPIQTSPLILDLGTPRYVAIGALCPSELYDSTTCSGAAGSSRAAIVPPIEEGDQAIHINEQLFVRNSVNRRLFIVDNPVRFCISAANLLEYRNYDPFTGVENTPAVMPGLVVDGVSAPLGSEAFQLSGGSEDRNTALRMNLVFHQEGSSIELNHQVLVRNVP